MMTAISAIDVALWDIKAKALGTPLYNLLGGKSRDRVLVYAHHRHRRRRVRDRGERRGRADRRRLPGGARPVGACPASRMSTASPPRGRPTSPAGRGVAAEHRWDTSKYLRSVPPLFARVREVYGEDPHLLHDVHHRCTPRRGGARLARELEKPFHLLLARGRGRGRAPGGAALRAPALDDSARDRRSVQLGLRRDDARHRAARGLPADADRARRRDHALAEGGGLRVDLPRADRLPRGDRSVARDPLGGAPLRYGDQQLWNPGIHASRGAREQRLHDRLPLREGRAPRRRFAGPRRRHRRGGREAAPSTSRPRCRWLASSTAP